MGKVLTDDAIRALREDGIHFPLRVFADEDMRALNARLEASKQLLGGKMAGRNNQKPHLLFPWLNELVRTPRILDAVSDALGSEDLLCWSAAFFAKGAGDGSFVSWHQDATYWGLSSPEVVTAWLAFTPSTVESGCMRVVPGSHRVQLEHKDTFDGRNLLTRGQEVAVEVQEEDAVDVILQPGEISLHNVLLVHGSAPNTASWPRIGFAMRYIPPHLRQINGARDSATLVRGKDRYGHFDLEQAPKADLHPDAVAQHARIAAQQAALFYKDAKQKARANPSNGS